MQSLCLSAATKASTDPAITSGEKATESFMFVLQQFAAANLSDTDTVWKEEASEVLD